LSETVSSAGTAGHWLSASSAVDDDANFRSTTEELVYTLPEPSEVDRIHLWPYIRSERNRGLKTCDISFSTDNGSTWPTTISAATLGDFQIGPSGGTALPETKTFAAQTGVTDIRLTNLTTFGSTSFIGISELRFGIEPNQAELSALVYEGFATSATGTGADYQADVSIKGQSDLRTGMTGAWGGSFTSSEVDFYPRESQNMQYAGFRTGDVGVTELFRTGASDQSRSFSRSLAYNSPGTDDFYCVFGWATDDAIPVSMSLPKNGSRGGINVNVSATGVVSFSLDGNSRIEYDSGAETAHMDGSWNLLVINVMDDPGGASSAWYDTYEVWLNPTISDGSLGAPDFTDGRAIIRNQNGDGHSIGFASVNFGATPTIGSEAMFDEFYITTDLSDFLAASTTVIPEPSTFLIWSLGLIGLAWFGRRRRKR
jgi:hypothetical protein